MYGHLSDRTYTIQYEFFVQSIFVLPPANFDIIDLQFYQIGLIQYEFFLLSIFARSAHVFSVDKIIWNLRVVKEEGKKISDWLSIIDGGWESASVTQAWYVSVTISIATSKVLVHLPSCISGSSGFWVVFKLHRHLTDRSISTVNLNSIYIRQSVGKILSDHTIVTTSKQCAPFVFITLLSKISWPWKIYYFLFRVANLNTTLAHRIIIINAFERPVSRFFTTRTS